MTYTIADLVKDHADLRVCNCAGCGELLQAKCQKGPLPMVAGFVTHRTRLGNDLTRPYCKGCAMDAVKFGSRDD